jgi:hypothetical protein
MNVSEMPDGVGKAEAIASFAVDSDGFLVVFTGRRIVAQSSIVFPKCANRLGQLCPGSVLAKQRNGIGEEMFGFRKAGSPSRVHGPLEE